jgi:hypothetical protein
VQTVLTSYYFDTRNPEESAAYKKLAARLRETNGRCFETSGGRSHYNAAWREGMPVALETKHLFMNQWNSDVGRIFDWAQDYPIAFGKHIKRGHYLAITDEMRAIRHDAVKCRYCGHMDQAAAGHEFCPKCPGSEYLAEKDLKLTRLMRVDDDSPVAELTEAEAAVLIPRWREAQGLGKQARAGATLSKRRQSIARLVPEAEAKAAADIKAARIEAAALTWLMDAGYRDIDNVIYYPHTGRFGFGWREPLGAAEYSALLDILGAKFPFDYDIKHHAHL